MRILNSITGFFQSIRQAWSLIQLIRELNAIRTSFPGVADETKLRRWLQANAVKLAAFAHTTKNTIDDAIAVYVRAILDSDTTWAILYNSLRLAAGFRALDAVYGSASDIPHQFDERQIQVMEDRTKCLLEHTGLVWTHEQFSMIAMGAILAVVAQLQEE